MSGLASSLALLLDLSNMGIARVSLVIGIIYCELV